MTKEEREAAIKYFELFGLDCSNDCELCPSGKDCKAYSIVDANKFAKLAIEALQQPVINISCFYEPQSNGGCIGLGNGDDDEPIDRCKICPLHYINIEESEEIQQPEIVRCENCKHAYNRSAMGTTRLFCDFDSARKYVIGDTAGVEFEVEKDDFCSYGERRSK